MITARECWGHNPVVVEALADTVAEGLRVVAAYVEESGTVEVHAVNVVYVDGEDRWSVVAVVEG